MTGGTGAVGTGTGIQFEVENASGNLVEMALESIVALRHPGTSASQPPLRWRALNNWRARSPPDTADGCEGQRGTGAN